MNTAGERRFYPQIHKEEVVEMFVTPEMDAEWRKTLVKPEAVACSNGPCATYEEALTELMVSATSSNSMPIGDEL